MARRLRTLHARLQPRPKQEVWMPPGLCLIEEEGELYYANEEAQAIDERCRKLGITPNVYMGFNPDEDGCEA